MNASLPEPQGLGGWVSHSSAEGLLEGSEMEHQRTERIPFGSNGVGFDEKGFEQQPVKIRPQDLTPVIYPPPFFFKSETRYSYWSSVGISLMIPICA